MRRLLLALALTLAVAGPVSAQSGGPVTTSFAQNAPVTAAWTSATPVNTAITITTTGYAEAVVRVNGVAPLTDGRLIFEGDDGTSTFAWRIAGQRSDASALSEDQPAIVPQNTAWTVPISGFVSFRVRLQTAISSSGTANLSVSLSAAAATEPNAQLIVTALQQFTAQMSAAFAQRGRLFGTFGRPVTSTGDALDVNVKYQPAAVDACTSAIKGNAAISQTANARLIAGVPGKRIAICAGLLVGADAENVSLVEGTGATCGTGTVAVIGGATAAAGPNLAANGGFAIGNGLGAVANTVGSGTDVCLFQSGSGRVAGNLTYAYQQ